MRNLEQTTIIRLAERVLNNTHEGHGIHAEFSHLDLGERETIVKDRLSTIAAEIEVDPYALKPDAAGRLYEEYLRRHHDPIEEALKVQRETPRDVAEWLG